MKFGTDGIRGVAYSQLTLELAKSVGNILSIVATNKKILIGRDTRVSGEDLAKALSEGFTSNGGEVIDCGIMPTAGVAYLTKLYDCEYGVVISASHNPPEYNGIKVFDNQGYKISEELEHKIESMLFGDIVYGKQGKVINCEQGAKDYVEFLAKKGVSLEGYKVLLDCSNGASGKIAPMVFKSLGADVTVINDSQDGNLINDKCGAVHADLLSDKAKKIDMTFSFDGDSDRLIALDEKGNVVDGDMILYILGRYFKQKGELVNNLVTGTLNTNMGIEKYITDLGIEFDRVDVGDKYILRNLLAKGGILGGEGSGHTIMLNESSTGDGVQTAVVLSKVIKESKKTLSQLMDAKLTPQINKAIIVKDKDSMAKNPQLIEKTKELEAQLGFGRILIRPSGTENKLRLTVEGINETQLNHIVNILTNLIQSLES